MSTQNENTGDSTSTGGAEGEDLSASLGGNNEVEFVGTTEEKKPMNTQYMILIGLVVLAPLVMWYMYKGKGPDAAAGATPAISPASQTVHTFLDSGNDGVSAMREMLKGTEKIVKEFLSYPSMAQIPLADLKTNPFRVTKDKPGDQSEAANKRKRDEERQAIVKAVQGLQLQSIIAGKKGACMINNTLYTEGQQVGQFIIEKISTGTVIVKSGAYRFELKMQK
jgi:hypothetical protein